MTSDMSPRSGSRRPKLRYLEGTVERSQYLSKIRGGGEETLRGISQRDKAGTGPKIYISRFCIFQVKVGDKPKDISSNKLEEIAKVITSPSVVRGLSTNIQRSFDGA